MEIAILVLGIVLGVFGVIGVRTVFHRKRGVKTRVEGPKIQVFLENMKSIGELVVFKEIFQK